MLDAVVDPAIVHDVSLQRINECALNPNVGRMAILLDHKDSTLAFINNFSTVLNNPPSDRLNKVVALTCFCKRFSEDGKCVSVKDVGLHAVLQPATCCILWVHTCHHRLSCLSNDFRAEVSNPKLLLLDEACLEPVWSDEF